MFGSVTNPVYTDTVIVPLIFEFLWAALQIDEQNCFLVVLDLQDCYECDEMNSFIWYFNH